MERKSLWKNFLLLALGSLIVFHVEFAGAQDDTSSDSDEGCILSDDE